MKEVINAFLKDKGLAQSNFNPNSRYYGLETAEWKRPDGQVVVYVKQRLVPKPEEFSTVQEHTVAENDRLDNIADKYFFDPELYWQLCDANGAMRPWGLTAETGKTLNIGSLTGVPEPAEGQI